ncbi:MAG: hypothetical protein IJT25_02910 [Clostridia bacterium]|nr:hypothetical protein [Clostridia bacterium]
MVTETSTETRRVPSWQTSSYDEDEDDYNTTPNFFSSRPYTQTQVEDSDEEETEPAFEIEKNYSSSDEEDEEENEKQDFVMAKKGLLDVRRKQEAQPIIESVSKPKLSARLKIALTVYSLVLALIVGFAIYNTVAISSMGNSINATSYEISMEQGVINDLEAEYNELGTSASIKERVPNGYVEIVDGENSFSSIAPVLDEEEVISLDSNWFDKVCEFFSSLF